MAITSSQLPIDEDNAPGDTITAAFRKKHGIGDTGKLPLPPKGHPLAKTFAAAVLRRAHQVKGLPADLVAKQVARAHAILNAKESAGVPWREVAWVDVARPTASGFTPVSPKPNELCREFLRRIPTAVPVARAATMTLQERANLVGGARPTFALRESAPGGAAILSRLNEAVDLAGAKNLNVLKDVLLIRSGPGNLGSRNWYTPQALQRAVENEAFEGARCFYDHAGPHAEREQPGGSVRLLAGWYSDTKVREYDDPVIGKTSGLYADFHPAVGDERVLSIVRTCAEYKSRYPTQDYAGLSINAEGAGAPAEIQGEPWNRIDEILKSVHNSVDIVTAAGAGGSFLVGA